MTDRKISNENELLAPRLEEIYDLYRTALLSRKYFGHRLVRTHQKNRAIEWTIALAASASVAAWWAWTTTVGSALWGVLGGIAAVLALVKPYLHYPQDIERYSKLTAAYSTVFSDLRAVIRRVKTSRQLTQEDMNWFLRVADRMTDH